MNPWCVLILSTDREPIVRIPVMADTGEQAIGDAVSQENIVPRSGMQGFAFRLDDSSTVRKKVTVAYGDITDVNEVIRV